MLGVLNSPPTTGLLGMDCDALCNPNINQCQTYKFKLKHSKGSVEYDCRLNYTNTEVKSYNQSMSLEKMNINISKRFGLVGNLRRVNEDDNTVFNLKDINIPRELRGRATLKEGKC